MRQAHVYALGLPVHPVDVLLVDFEQALLFARPLPDLVSGSVCALAAALHPQLIALAVSPSNDIKAVEQAHHLGEPESQDDDDDIGVRSTNTGAILKWENADQLSAVGILYVVLALVLVHGRAISDADLRRILKLLRIPLPSPLPPSIFHLSCR